LENKACQKCGDRNLDEPFLDNVVKKKQPSAALCTSHLLRAQAICCAVHMDGSFQDISSVRLAYHPPASSTFLSEQTSNQPAVLFSQNKSASATSQTNKLSVILIHRATFCTLAADNCIAVMQLGLLGYTFALL
jgi:hypothetical protein